jgi:S1-C subfamily serine protease
VGDLQTTITGQGAGALAAAGPGTPAAGAGLQPGDVISAADGTTIGSAADLRSVIAPGLPLAARAPGQLDLASRLASDEATE